MNIREIYDRVSVNENTDIGELVIDINCSVFNIVHKKLYKGLMEEGNVRHLAKSVCKVVKANTESAEKGVEVLESIIKDLQGVIGEVREKEEPAILLCKTIATASDTTNKYTAIENAILTFAAASFSGVEFDF